MSKEKSTITIGVEPTIVHNGETFFWVSFFADGSYYENEKGYALTNGGGNVEFASVHARELMRDRRNNDKGYSNYRTP